MVGKQYKIETHLHTKIVSKCGWLYPDHLIRKYKEAGYDAICLTEHYNRDTVSYGAMDLSVSGSKMPQFLKSYDAMCEEAAKAGILIYKGAELRFDQNENDYLLFGFHDELLAEPDEIMKLGVHQFADRYRADGALMLQAHPFRKSCMPCPAEYLDGLEVFNGNPRHESHNDQALLYAERHGLIMTAGSDCHQVGDEGRAGILSDTLPKDTFEFAALLRSGNYELFHV